MTGQSDASTFGPLEFYETLAPTYAAQYMDWTAESIGQARVLDRLVREYLGSDGPFEILDCACGIGTQLVGLAHLGHRLAGSDLSPRALDEARRRCADHGVSACLTVADFREPTPFSRQFDVVICCDNALPHVVDSDEMMGCLRSIYGAVRPGGLFVASTRDYDAALIRRAPDTEPKLFRTASGEHAVFQVWEWQGLARYRLQHFVLKRKRGEGWDVCHATVDYRAWRRDELTRLLLAVGFIEVEWRLPAQSGYFQPVVAAIRSDGHSGADR